MLQDPQVIITLAICATVTLCTLISGLTTCVVARQVRQAIAEYGKRH